MTSGGVKITVVFEGEKSRPASRAVTRSAAIVAGASGSPSASQSSTPVISPPPRTSRISGSSSRRSFSRSRSSSPRSTAFRKTLPSSSSSRTAMAAATETEFPSAVAPCGKTTSASSAWSRIARVVAIAESGA